MARSVREGHIVATEAVDTIADGIAVRVPTPGAVALLGKLLDRVVEVTDTTIRSAMHLCLEGLDLVLEPASAAGVASALDDRPAPEETVATILTGSNIGDDDRRSLLAP